MAVKLEKLLYNLNFFIFVCQLMSLSRSTHVPKCVRAREMSWFFLPSFNGIKKNQFE